MEVVEEIKVKPFDLLIQAIDENFEHFYEAKKFNALKFKLKKLKKSLENCDEKIVEIESFASDYDFDHETPGNGYRSYVDVYNSAIKKSLKLCEQLITSREKILFRADYYAKYNVQLWFRITQF